MNIFFQSDVPSKICFVDADHTKVKDNCIKQCLRLQGFKNPLRFKDSKKRFNSFFFFFSIKGSKRANSDNISRNQISANTTKERAQGKTRVRIPFTKQQMRYFGLNSSTFALF